MATLPETNIFVLKIEDPWKRRFFLETKHHFLWRTVGFRECFFLQGLLKWDPFFGGEQTMQKLPFPLNTAFLSW